mgnify:CR=1 FL=1
MERFIKRMAVIIYIILAFFLHPFPLIMTLSFNRHSERAQECFVGMKGNDDVMRSDESVTPMRLCGSLLPHYGSRFFACARDDAFRSLPFFFTTVIDPSLALGMTTSAQSVLRLLSFAKEEGSAQNEIFLKTIDKEILIR